MLKTIIYKNREIVYHIKGEGLCLVFLHGYLESKEVWNEFLSFFEDKYKTLCIDLPGHGNSETITSDFAMRDMGKLINIILQTNSIDNYVLIGHSMGGYVALAHAEQNYKPKALVLFSSSALNDSTQKKLDRNKAIDCVENGKKEQLIESNIPRMFAVENRIRFTAVIKQIKSKAKQMSEAGIISALNAMKGRKNYLEFLRRSNLPKLFIAGAKDELIPLSVSEEQAKACKNLEFRILENSGHIGFVEEKEKSAQIILDFLSKI